MIAVERTDFVGIPVIAAGVTFEFPELYDAGVCHMAFFKNPDGNALILHHRYAPHSDGSLP